MRFCRAETALDRMGGLFLRARCFLEIGDSHGRSGAESLPDNVDAVLESEPIVNLCASQWAHELIRGAVESTRTTFGLQTRELHLLWSN